MAETIQTHNRSSVPLLGGGTAERFAKTGMRSGTMGGTAGIRSLADMVILRNATRNDQRNDALNAVPGPFQASSSGGTTPSAIASRAAQPDPDIERAAIIEFDARVPRSWADGFARLLTQPAPAGVSSERWEIFLDDCGRFLDRWAGKADALGWQAHNLFGLAGTKPAARIDLAGLCWLLGGRELLALTDRTAAIKTSSGAVQHYCRTNPQPGQRMAWEPGGESR